MIEAIVFDMGGVLLNLDFDKCIKSFQDLGFSDIANYLDTYHQKDFIGNFEEGLIDENEFLRQCCEHCAPLTSKEAARKAFCDLCDGLNMPMIGLLKELSSKYDLYLLSNCNPISSQAFCEMLLEQGIIADEIFSKRFLSYEMKLQKPGKEIFERTIELIARKPENILFVDDSPANCAAAQELGIKTFCYKPDNDLLEVLL